MRNMTITLDEESYRNARIVAAERGISASALVRELLTSRAACPKSNIRNELA
jgi:plasmid stability protein